MALLVRTMIFEGRSEKQYCWVTESTRAFLLTKPFPLPLPQSYEKQELLRLIYYGGIQPEIRKAVWPFLLGHYQFGMTEAERKEVGYP